MSALVRVTLCLVLLACPACFAPPRTTPMPRLRLVEIETKTQGQLTLRDVIMVTLRSGVEEQRRVLPAPRRHERGIPWEGIRTIVVPPRSEFLRGTEVGDLLAPLKVTTRGTGREQVFLVDAGPGRKELLLRGLNADGIEVSIDLLDCLSLRVISRP